MKYHIKPLGTTKTQGFQQNLCGYCRFYTRQDYVST